MEWKSFIFLLEIMTPNSLCQSKKRMGQSANDAGIIRRRSEISPIIQRFVNAASKRFSKSLKRLANCMLTAYNCMQMNNKMKSFLTHNQLLLLGLFYTNPEKSFYMQEVGKILGKKPGVFQRTLNALVKEGLLTSEYHANARYFQANAQNPFYPEFRKIVAKSVGVEGSLRELVEDIKAISLAILYGSFAKGKERRESDVDILIVGKPEAENRLLKKLSLLEKNLQRQINYKWYSQKEYGHKRLKKDPFLEEVLNDRHIVLKGNPDAI